MHVNLLCFKGLNYLEVCDLESFSVWNIYIVYENTHSRFFLSVTIYKVGKGMMPMSVVKSVPMLKVVYFSRSIWSQNIESLAQNIPDLYEFFSTTKHKMKIFF